MSGRSAKWKKNRTPMNFERFRIGLSFRIASAVVLLIASALLSSFIQTKIANAQLMKHIGLEKRPIGYRLESKLSTMSYTEYGVDESGNGIVDTWIAKVYEGEKTEVVFRVSDFNQDGLMDDYGCLVGAPERNNSYAAVDRDGDNVIDFARISLVDYSSSDAWVDYMDLDLDGNLDTMTKVVQDDVIWVKIRIEDEWIHTEVVDSGSQYLVPQADGSVREAWFTDGGWRIDDDETSADEADAN